MKYTKGNWKAYLTEINPDRWTICAGEGGDIGIATTCLDTTLSSKEMEANAHLIATSPRMAEWIEMVVVTQKGWLYQRDIDEAKKILAKAERE